MTLTRFGRSVALGLAMVMAAGGAWGDEQVKDDLFAGADKLAEHAKSSDEVNLDGKMLGAAGNTTGGDHKELLKKMDFVVIHSYTYAHKGDYQMSDIKAITDRLDGSGWSHLVKERSAGNTADICVKSSEDGKVTEMVVISAEPLAVALIHLKGHLSMDDLVKLGSSYGGQAMTGLQRR